MRYDSPDAGGAQQDSESIDERMKDQQRRTRQAELARLVLVWLLSVDGPVTWIGTAQAPEALPMVLMSDRRMACRHASSSIPRRTYR